jgi:hypothetical protein
VKGRLTFAPLGKIWVAFVAIGAIAEVSWAICRVDALAVVADAGIARPVDHLCA